MTGSAIHSDGANPNPTDESALSHSSVFVVPGLSEKARILVDRFGVPHIEANTFLDAFVAQGFNAARDRLFQIDLFYKRGLGLLSKDLGPDYVAEDRATRLFLYRGDINTEWASYGTPDAKQIAEAFVSGVNAYVAMVRADPSLLPFEFKALGYEPTFWVAEDFIRIRSHALTQNLRDEVARAKVAAAAGVGFDIYREAVTPSTWQLTVPAGLDVNSIPANVLDVYTLATQSVTFQNGQVMINKDEDRTNGSNNWVISPDRTKTGRPILCNDPHRAETVPSLRYITHLRAPGLDVIGAGEPYQPGVSIGHNQNIAYGLTIFDIDQEDMYVYDTNPSNPNEYLYNGKFIPMEVVQDQIEVKGGAAVPVQLKFTQHGPVIFEDAVHHKAFAVRTVWSQPGTAAYFGNIGYIRAKDVNEFIGVMKNWRTPSENQVVADVNGNIAWVPRGLAPIRPNWDGMLPVPGDGRYEWNGFWDASVLPLEVNPSRGFAATANQFDLPEGYPYATIKLGFSGADPSRFNRITEVLQQNSNSSIEDSARLQFDHVNLYAPRLNQLLKHDFAIENQDVSSDPSLAKAVNMLLTWNGDMDVTSPPAALFEIWLRRELLPQAVAILVPAAAQPAVLPGDPATIVPLLEHPDARLGKNPLAARRELLKTSLKAAFLATQQLLGADPGTWQWGNLHMALWVHQLSSISDPATQSFLNVGPFPLGGDSYTIAAATYNQDFIVTSGPSYREVIDVGDWDNSLIVNTPGQSGDPYNRHYRDLAPLWVKGEYFPMLFSFPLIKKATELEIRLVPDRSSSWNASDDQELDGVAQSTN
jgi:penicillin amidase